MKNGEEHLFTTGGHGQQYGNWLGKVRVGLPGGGEREKR